MKATKIFAAAAAILAAFVSCQVQIDEVQETKDFSDVKLVPITFNAETATTKTTLGEDLHSIVWEEDDQIRIFDDTESYKFYDPFDATKSGETTGFTGLVDETATTFFALYPYDAEAEWAYDAEEDYACLTTTLKTTQEARVNGLPAQTNITFAKADENNIFTFQNLCAVVKFKLTREDISLIEIEPNGGEDAIALAGGIEVTSEEGIITVTRQDKDTDTKSLSISPAEGDTFAPGTYYVCALPETYGSGITVTFTNTETATAEITSDSALSLKAGKIRNLGTIDGNLDFSEDTPSGYMKVTEKPTDWSGEYLLVYETTDEDSNPVGYCWTGVDAVSCYVTAQIKDEVISTKPEGAVTVTITSMDDGYSIQVNGGTNISKFIKGTSGSNALGFDANAQLNNISYNNKDKCVDIVSNTSVMRYNSASNNNRFRYFKESSYTGQQVIQLYKLAGEPAPAKTLTSITVSGTPDKKKYYVGEEFDPAGLVVTGTYDDDSEGPVSSGITWTIDPETMAETTTSVSVTASVGEISSEAYIVTGLSVTTEPATIDLNNTLYGIETGNNGKEQTTTTDEGITIVSGCTSSATAKTYYDSEHIRYYTDSYLKVSVDGTISKIAFTSAGTWNEDGISANTDTYNNKIWTGSASEVVFSFTKQCRVASIEVTYEIDSTPKYNVSCSEVEGGILSASPSRAISGTLITLTATPNDEYTFNNDWSVKGADNTSITVNDGTFTLPEQNVTVSGSFTKKTYTITKNAAEHGTYTVTDKDGASVTSASKGDKITLTASPAEGYILNKWVVKDANDKDVTVSNNAFSMPASAVSISAYFVAEEAVPEYASLEDLVAADLTSNTTVKVSFENVPIKDFYVYGKYTNGIYFDIQKEGKDIEIYYQNVPSNWVVGGTVSGTMTCPWKKYNGTWELAPDQGSWDWNNLAYTAPLEPCADPVITISDSGSATITCATAGASIYYTVGDTPADPTEASALYSSAVTMTDGQTIKAIAYKDGMKASAIVQKTYAAGGQGDDKPVVLTFDLTKNPGGWPTTNSTTLTDYTYTLNGTSYTFGLKNVKCNSGYLMLTSTAVLGLPAIEGKKLTKVVAKNSSGCSTSTKVGVSSSSSSATYIKGGAIQTWSTTSTEYTYNLTETEDNTVYYLYVTNKNAQIVTLTLTYE